METCIGLITVSDTRTPAADRSGPAALAALEALGYGVFERRLVRDDVERIRSAILELCGTCQAVFTIGGTGFSPRDVTPEATTPLIEKRADSLTELMRLRGLEHTPFSHLSRGVAGVRGATLIVNLPGSPKAAQQGIEAIGPLLAPILSALGGDGCPVQ